MEWAGCLAVAGAGIALIAAAINPDLPVLRSLWGTRVFDRRLRPTRFERQETAVLGTALIVAAAALFVYLYWLR
jgi:hypothetical protein